MNANTVSNLSLLSGRALLSAMFITAGFSKLGAYAGTEAYMESVGVPGLLLPAVIALEIVGGLAILAGYRAKFAALLLAGFTLMAALIFHSDFSQPMQYILFSKNLAIAGGFLVLFAHGAGDWTLQAIGKGQRVAA
jgi:putative oxidoreductase